MLDLVYVAAMLGLVGLAALFILACDKIIGPDEVALEEDVRGVREPVGRAGTP
ncbi:hypothetical protein ACQP2K_42375 [Microbispora siamensis]